MRNLDLGLAQFIAARRGLLLDHEARVVEQNGARAAVGGGVRADGNGECGLALAG